MQHAYRLVAEEGALSQRVMRELAQQARAFADLQPLGLNRAHGALAETLNRLQSDGLIARRASQRQVPIVHTYTLTPLGAEAESAMQRLRPLSDMARPAPRRQRSALGASRMPASLWASRTD